MKVKIALFRSTHYGWENVFQEANVIDGYYRVSEWMEVELAELPPKEVVPNALEELDKEEKELRLRLEERLQRVDDARGKFLALTAPTP